ncbi:DUF6019 family protein [Vagococcus acidifermentans]|uniref:Uncharacterized protein n=1 Tax=Vagococcus acidifermentans TaxID=564710 RepID=A0A430B2M4_9ENTE|nr:DUF6019 family protein [Vagococcus acidifermentans]RSU14580.1 hypothetical protein CBF27_00940 [Vagococcus acidifermentans]
MVWQELGISGITGLVVLTALYFVIKASVKNGILSAYQRITKKQLEPEFNWDELKKENQENG